MGRTSLVALCLLVSIVSPARAGFGVYRAATTHLSTLKVYVADPLAKQQPQLSVETFPLPTLDEINPELMQRLSIQTGVAGTEIVGIRLKVGLPAGYVFESVDVGLADGMFLMRDRSFLGAVGNLLARVARFLLFGHLVSAGTDLEIPGQAWAVLLDFTPLGQDDPVTLHTRRTVKSHRNDRNTSDHGEYMVCRYLVAANALSELVGIQVVAHDPVRGTTVRYKLPRLKLPPIEFGPTETEPDEPTSPAKHRRDVALASPTP